MKVHRLHKELKLPITVEEAWEFLSNPNNLKLITPEEMNFDIISEIDREVYSGQIIQHQVTPLLGIKTTWVSKITHVEKYHYFVDEQLYGPYAFWSHKHFIHKIERGVIMEDIIDYKVPFGPLGKLMHPFFVKPKLEEVFLYRTNKLIERFGEYK